jgi:hypothetical protein
VDDEVVSQAGIAIAATASGGVGVTDRLRARVEAFRISAGPGIPGG